MCHYRHGSLPLFSRSATLPAPCSNLLWLRNAERDPTAPNADSVQLQSVAPLQAGARWVRGPTSSTNSEGAQHIACAPKRPCSLEEVRNVERLSKS